MSHHHHHHSHDSFSDILTAAAISFGGTAAAIAAAVNGKPEAQVAAAAIAQASAVAAAEIVGAQQSAPVAAVTQPNPPMQVQAAPSAQYNPQAAQQHVHRHHHHKHKANSFWRGVFKVVKIVAIGATAAITAPLGGPLIAAAACASTDAAIQFIGVKTGCQDKFSLNEVLETGVTAGVGSSAVVAASGMVPKAMTTAASAAITQAAEVHLHMREDLDPAAVAMQGASSVVSSAINEAMPIVHEVIQKAAPELVETVGQENVALVTSGIANATANSFVNSAINDTSFGLDSAVLNTLGSVFGTKIGNVLNEKFNISNIDQPDISVTNETSNDDEFKNDFNLDDICVVGDDVTLENIQLPTDEQLNQVFKLIDEAYERLNSIPVSKNNGNSAAPEANLIDSEELKFHPAGHLDVEPTLHPPCHETSILGSLSLAQKITLGTAITAGAIMTLPGEVTLGALLLLSRVGTAVLPGVGPLSEAVVVDGVAGEAIGATTAGAAAGTFFSKLMGKVGLFKSAEIAEIAEVESAVTKAIAKYPKQVEQYSNLTEKQLEKAIKSHEKQIALHEDKLANPENYVPNWNEITSQHQQSLITRWNNDIARHQSYSEIAEHMLQNLLEKAPKNGR